MNGQMAFTITLAEIGYILLFILAAALGIYLLIVLKNANQLISNANKTLTENRKNIDELLAHLEKLSSNAAVFSCELKDQFERNERMVSSIIRTGADSMVAISDTTERIRTLTASFTEIIEALKRLFK